MRRRGLWFAILLTFPLVPTPATGQPAFSGPEMSVGSVPPNVDVYRVALAAHPGGGYTAVWRLGYESEGQYSPIHARRFDSRGLPRTAEIVVGQGINPSVAALGEGFVVVGLQTEESAPGNLIRIYNAAGEPLGAAFPFDTPATASGSAYYSEPAVAADRDGNFAIAWTAQARVYLRRFSARGVPRGEPVPLPATIPVEPQSSPSLARAASGEIAVVWHQGQGASWRLLGQRFNRFGEPEGNPFLVSYGAYDSLVAFAKDGGLLVAWTGTAADQYCDYACLWVQRFDRSRRPLGERIRLDSIETAPAAPELLPGPAGSFVAVWQGWRGIHVRRIAADGSLSRELATGRWRPRVEPPAAAAGWGDGTFAILWARTDAAGRYPPRELRVQRFASETPGVLRLGLGRYAFSESEPRTRVLVERREGSQGAASVSYTLLARDARSGEDFEAGSGVVSFDDGESLPKSIDVRLLDDAVAEGDESLAVVLSGPGGGASLAAPARARIEIRDDDTPSPLLAAASPTVPIAPWPDSYIFPDNPTLAAAADGTVLFSWEEVRQSRWPPFWRVTLYPPGGGDRIELASVGRAANGRVAVHPEGFFTLTSARYTEGSENPDVAPRWIDSVGQRFTSQGQPVGSAFPLLAVPLATAAGSAGGLLTLWQEPAAEGRQALLFAAYDGAGRSLGAPVRIDEAPAAGDPEAPPVLAADGQGRGLAVWKSAFPDGDRILARRVNASGPLGPEIAVDVQPGRFPDRQAVAAAAGGGFVVAWEADDGDGTGVFARRFGPDGAPLGDIFQANSRSAWDQSHPRVAVRGDGRFVVLWQSPGRAGRPEVRAQYFAADGSRLGTELAVDPDGSGPSDEATLATDPAGHFVAAFQHTVVGSYAFFEFRRFPSP